MKRKRIKYVANIDFGYRSITDAKQYIKIFLKSLLSQIGLQLGIDYIVTANHLRIRHVKNITGKILPHLKRYSQYSIFIGRLQDYWCGSRININNNLQVWKSILFRF